MNDTAIEAAIEVVLGNMIYVVSKREAKVFAHAAISAYLTQREADGFVMVPVEPSEAMLKAALCRSQKSTLEEGLYASVYRAMIEARPQVKP